MPEALPDALARVRPAPAPIWEGRMRRVVAAGLLCGVLLGVPAGPVSGAEEEPDFRIRGDEVTESSGLVVSRNHPGLAYTVNDSGDAARVFVVDMRSGEVVGETRLTGVEAVDVEALGTAPDGRLVVGDIGDNEGERKTIAVHMLAEPDRGRHAVAPHTVTLRYADGPRDAEALLASGDRLFVVSKTPIGAAVYAAPVFGENGDDRFRLRRFAPAPPIITAATVLADGRAVLRNYARAFVVSLPDFKRLGDFRLPPMRQGESVAAGVKGPWIYAGTEGANSPVYRLRVRLDEHSDEAPASPAPTASPGAAEASEEAPGQEAPGQAASGDGEDLPTWIWWAGAAVLVAGGVVARLLRR